MMQKRTTIYLEEADQEAIDAIVADHARRGVKLTESGAIRFALRELAARLAAARARGDRQAARAARASTPSTVR